jgi:hypothetical protein
MPLTSIVIILLRLFSLWWLVQAITSAVGVTAVMHPFERANYWNYGPSGVFLMAAVFTWLNTSLISRIVTPRPDTTVSIGGLTRYDLYCFAFVFLGLYFVLSSIGQAINWTYYFAVTAKDTPQNDPERLGSFYQLTQSLIPVVAGSVCIATASRFAKKLTVAQRNYEEASQAPPPST